MENKGHAFLPPWPEILPVYSLIVFAVFTWAIYRMAWDLQSWLFSMRLSEVLILAAYVMAFALVESLVVLTFVLLLALIFPGRLLKKRFVPQGSALIVLLTLGALLLQNHLDALYQMNAIELVLFPVGMILGMIIILAMLAFVFDKEKAIPRTIVSFADRLIIFSYIYIPISLLCLVVVIIRNIL